MTSCCSPKEPDGKEDGCHCAEAATPSLTPDFPVAGADCCGTQTPGHGLALERPGYRVLGFVDAMQSTAAGQVPRVHTRLNREDRFKTLRVRLGIGRDSYRIAPGLYAVGRPDQLSPVLVTANYKLTFDLLRSHLGGIQAWILVLDTRSINVWCAAGKGTFSTDEVAARVKATGLEKVVIHRRLILPQLAATGVHAMQVKRSCGFEVVWGPVHARDLPSFLEADMQATPEMRQVTFGLRERVELIPVEIKHMGKKSLYVLPALLVLSGIGPAIFSVGSAVSRGLVAMLAYLLAIVSGAVLAPMLLPWLPGRAFALKGALVGAVVGVALSLGFMTSLTWMEMSGLTLMATAISSYLAMNFTGSTPFTSPTGVEKEMRRAIPAQAVGTLTAVVLWVGGAFYKG